MALQPATIATDMWEEVDFTEKHSSLTLTRNVSMYNAKTKEVLISLTLKGSGSIPQNTQLLKLDKHPSGSVEIVAIKYPSGGVDSAFRAAVLDTGAIHVTRCSIANNDEIYISGSFVAV